MSSIQRVRRFVLAVACASAAAFLLAAPPSARADDTYAAIAFSPKTGHYGIGNINFDSREKAEKAALAKCDADDAQVAVWVKNGCCAMTVGGGGKYGIGVDADRETAVKTAIADCRKITHYGDTEAGGFTVSTHSDTRSTGAADIEDAPKTPSVADEIIRLTNAERKKAGVPALTKNAKLTAMEVKYAALMAQKDMLSHDLDGGLGDGFTRAGYNYAGGGENIAAGQADAAAVVAKWMSDPPHKANLLNPAFTEIGVGVAANADGKPYYAQMFGTPAP